jgi:tetratricopeptide (TPR) repeat protein
MKRIIRTMALGAMFIAGNSFAAVNSGDEKLDKYIQYLQKNWAEINYTITNEEEKEAKLAKLGAEADAVVSKYPQYAEPKIWDAIITSTEAGVKGGLGALGLVKKSKKLLEEAQAINPNALDGSAYTSLGSLYYKVPGWPIGFGSDKEARKNLEKALQINPNGIDPNYFYGEFLYEEGEYQRSYQVLQKALNAPARADRPLADKGRKGEIMSLLTKVEKKLK